MNKTFFGVFRCRWEKKIGVPHFQKDNERKFQLPAK